MHMLATSGKVNIVGLLTGPSLSHTTPSCIVPFDSLDWSSGFSGAISRSKEAWILSWSRYIYISYFKLSTVKLLQHEFHAAADGNCRLLTMTRLW